MLFAINNHALYRCAGSAHA